MTRGKQRPARAKAKGRVKVVVNARPRGLLASLQSKRTGLIVVLAFIVVGMGTLWWVKAATATYSLWYKRDTPRTISHRDTARVELGVKFMSQYAGYVTGIRFYKGPQNTGVHVGNLWNSTGRKLATVTFQNETASGWQTAYFAQSVPISAKTIYVISYLAPNGHYSVNPNYFTKPRVLGPLTAPATGNGVYAYTASSAFPNKTHLASNYWVDVLFSTSRFNPTPRPQAPTNLQAAVVGDSVNLTWQHSPTSGVTKYEVLRDGVVVNAQVTVPAYSDSGLASGTYAYQVRAVDAGGKSDLSNAATATIPADPNPPPTPPPGTGSCVGSANTPGGSDGAGCWPGPHNTGYPKGMTGDWRAAVTLTDYTGPCTITSSATIDRKKINCGTLAVRGDASVKVTITNSLINGGVFNDPDNSQALVVIEDSEINGGNDTNYSGIMFANYKLLRVNVHGGGHNAYCASNCTIEDSWLHTPVSAPESHNNAFFGWGNSMTLTHNTFACDIPTVNNGGCSADVFLKGGSHTVTLTRNLFVATPNGGFYYCTYGAEHAPQYGESQEHHIVYIDNVFQRGPSGKCGVSAPVTSFVASAPGNQWTNNRWDNGVALSP